jgi:hypothetical protein
MSSSPNPLAWVVSCVVRAIRSNHGRVRQLTILRGCIGLPQRFESRTESRSEELRLFPRPKPSATISERETLPEEVL